jgi:hypothetical protein
MLRCVTLLSYCLVCLSLFAQTGTPADPFTALAQAREVSAAGTYSFLLDGVAFSTHVDAGGFVLLAYDNSNATEALPRTAALTATTYGILSPSAMATLGQMEEVRISSSDPGQLDAVTPANGILIQRITTFQSLMSGSEDNAHNEFWTGTGSAFLRADAGTTRAVRALDEEIFHVYRNAGAGGVHWIPSRGDRNLVYDNAVPVPEAWSLWVRGGIGVPVDSTNGVGTEEAPFTSLTDALGVPGAGVYFFNLNGLPFRTLVDANGYVQIAVDYGESIPSALPQGTDLDGSRRGILTSVVLAELTETRQLRMSSNSGTLDATTTNASMIGRMLNNVTLFNGSADNADNDDWVGTGARYLTDDCGQAQNHRPLHEEIYHTYYAINEGMHWIPYRGDQALVYQEDVPASESYTLWVRAATRCGIMIGGVATTAASCLAEDGRATVSASCGDCTEGVEYSLDNQSFQSSPTFTGLAPGTHTVFARPAGTTTSCLIARSFTVTRPSEVSLPIRETGEAGGTYGDCWVVRDENGDAGWGIVEDAALAYGGSRAFYLPPSTTAGQDDRLLSPAFAAEPSVDYALTYYYSGTSSELGADLDVLLVNAADESVVKRLTIDRELGAYSRKDLVFRVPATGRYRIAFASEAGPGQNGVLLDDIDIGVFTAPTDGAADLAGGADQSCLTINGFGLSGFAWNRIVDPSGRVAVEINPNGNDLGDVVLETRNYAAPQLAPYNGQYHLSRHFNITPSNGSGPYTANGGVRVRLYYTDQELADFNATTGAGVSWDQLTVSHYSDETAGTEDCSIANSSGGTLREELLRGSGDYGGSAHYIEFTTTSFSEFAASSSSALPVTLLDFTGRPTAAGANQLTWRVAREEAFSHYEVESSTDGLVFSSRARIVGRGLDRYAYTDPAAAGLTYYRLRMVDLDGSYVYSKVVSVTGTGRATAGLRAYPVPTPGPVTLEFATGGDGPLRLRISDQLGRVVRQTTYTGSAKDQRIELDLHHLPPGPYWLTLSERDRGPQTVRIVRY